MVRRKNESCLICVRAKEWSERARAHRCPAHRCCSCSGAVQFFFPFSLSEIMIVCFCSFLKVKMLMARIRNRFGTLGKNGKYSLYPYILNARHILNCSVFST